MPRISLIKRQQVVELWNSQKPLRHICQQLAISLCAVQNIIKKVKCGYGVDDKPKCGRASILTPRDRNKLILISKKNPKLTAGEIRKEASLENKISISTVKRVLRSNGLFGRVSVKKPFICVSNKRKRLNWCKERRQWTHEWNRIIFSDECKLELHPSTRSFVRRPIGKSLKSRYLTPTRKFSPSIMVWGAIRSDGRRFLVKADGSVDSSEYQRILSVAFPHIYSSRYILQQDGATCHTSRSTSNYLTQHSIRILPAWPPQSPDINIIEHIWDSLKARIKQRHPSTIDELWKIALEEFNAIPNEEIFKLFHSIPRRIKAIIDAKGGNSKY